MSWRYIEFGVRAVVTSRHYEIDRAIHENHPAMSYLCRRRITIMKSTFLFCGFLFVIVVFASCKSSTAVNTPITATPTFHVGPRSDTLPYGKTWKEWSSSWWQWAVQMPPTHNPGFGTAPLDTLQTGNVWFVGGLAGYDSTLHRNQATTTGTIPYGTPILFSMHGLELDTGGGTYPYVGTTLAFDCRAGWSQINFISGGVTIDGIEIPNVLSYFVDTSMCVVNLPDSSLISDPRWRPGTPAKKCISPAATCGVYFFVDSLTRGQHIIHAQGESSFGSGSLTYIITVQ